MLIHKHDHDHSVRFFTGHSDTVDGVTEYAAAALKRGEPVLLATTPATSAAVLARLRKSSPDAADRVTIVNAVAVAKAMRGSTRSVAAGFQSLVVPVVKTAAAGSKRRLTAYGDIVNALWQSGCEAAALRLEQEW